jgi:hypothetical protein
LLLKNDGRSVESYFVETTTTIVKRRTKSMTQLATTPKPSQRADMPQIRIAMIQQAQQRGFSESEASSIADNFFKAWDRQGYDAAYQRFLSRIA